MASARSDMTRCSALQLQIAADDLAVFEAGLEYLRRGLPNFHATPAQPIVAQPIVPKLKPRPRWSRVGDCREVSRTTGQHCKGPASYANQLCYAHWRDLIGHRWPMDRWSMDHCMPCECGAVRIEWHCGMPSWPRLKKAAEAQLKEPCPANGKSERALEILDYLRCLKG